MSNHDTLQSWTTPIVAALIGVAYLVGGILGDDIQFGIFGLLLMLGVAAAMLIASRKSETVQGLLDRKDERIRSIDNDATMFAGLVLIVSIVGAFVIEIARGQDGSPYAALGAIGGAAYIVALVYLRIRR